MKRTLSEVEWLPGFPALVADSWPSLGTWIPKGHSYEGLKGPQVVLSWQVGEAYADTARRHAIALAILLHEYGHKFSGHRGTKMNAEEYGRHEKEANLWAAKTILDRFIGEPWAAEAFDYLANRIQKEAS